MLKKVLNVTGAVVLILIAAFFLLQIVSMVILAIYEFKNN